MGGRITVDSEPGKGTVFTVRLPLEVAADAHSRCRRPKSPRAPCPKPPLAAATILVIDDDPVIGDLMKSFLGKEGYHVVVAAGGEEGLAEARKVHPDVITLDVAMPRMDGWTVLGALKADPALADIPVIMLTMVDNKSMGYALGAVRLHDQAAQPRAPGRRPRQIQQAARPPPGAGRRGRSRYPHHPQDRARKGWLERRRSRKRPVALDFARAAVPGLVLLDLMMPEMDGFTFLEEFRRIADAQPSRSSSSPPKTSPPKTAAASTATSNASCRRVEIWRAC